MNGTLLLAMLMLVASAPSMADSVIDPALDPAAKGLAIARERARRDAGFGDSVVDVDMELIASDGRTRSRRLTWKTLEMAGADEGDRSLTVFHEPRDIAGTGFLSWTKLAGDDDQWLYLPALKRVKRIASTNRSGAFVGSEFTYEDLLADEVEKYDYRWLRDEPIGAEPSYVVERRPLYADSGYSRQLLWIDQAEFRTLRIQYFDRDGQLQKTLELEQYRQYEERFWRAQLMRMENHQNGKTTVLEFGTYEFRTGLSERDFDPAALRRLR